MTEDLNNIDHLFKSAIEGYEEMPSTSAWDAIDRKLDKSNIISIQKRYTHLKKLAVLLVLLLIGNITYDLHYTHSSGINYISASGERINKEDKIHLHPEININEQNSTGNKITVNEANSGNIVPEIMIGHHFNLMPVKGRYSTRSSHAKSSELNDEGFAATVSNKYDKSPFQYDGNLLGLIPRQVPAPANSANIINQTALLKKNSFPQPSGLEKSFATDRKTSQQKKHPLSVTIFYSPSLASDLLRDDDDNRSNNQDNAVHIKNGEQCQSSYSFGALLEYSVNKHWSIQSGLVFIKKVNHINPKTVYAENPGNGTIGYLFDFSSGYSYLNSKSVNGIAVGDSAQASRSINILEYLGIPIQAKYIVTKGKFNFDVSMGASYNTLLKGTLETEIENDSVQVNENVTKIAGLKPGYFSGLIGAGAEYQLNNKIAICFNPSFNFALTSITRGAPVKSFPGFISFAAGLHVHL